MLNNDSESLFGELSDFIEARKSVLKIPVVAVGVIAGGQEFTYVFGVTNVDHPLPVDEDTYFQIDSVTKTYPSPTTMRLVEAGKLDMEAPVRTQVI